MLPSSFMNTINRMIKLIILSLLLVFSNMSMASSLWLTEQMVRFRYDINHISHQELNKILATIEPDELILFDVRRPEEYHMSHIKGSIQIAPEMNAKDFISQYGNNIQNKTLIFYCSVGYRSSEFIQRISQQARQKGAKKLSNLKGGIFRWYNEDHTVINQEGETNNIHPSDESWAGLIDKR